MPRFINGYMKHFSRYAIRLRVLMIRVLIGAFVVALFFMPNFHSFERKGNNSFTIWIYGEEVGVVSNEKHADDLLAAARKSMATRKDSLVILDPMDYTITGEE